MHPSATSEPSSNPTPHREASQSEMQHGGHHADDNGEQAKKHDNGTSPASVGNQVITFVEQHPVVAAGAALAVGAAIVMLVNSRRTDRGRLDRRAMQVARNMERSFSREMKALRQSDFADRLGQVGSSFGDAMSRIDLAPLAELGKSYIEAAKAKLGR